MLGAERAAELVARDVARARGVQPLSRSSRSRRCSSSCAASSRECSSGTLAAGRCRTANAEARADRPLRRRRPLSAPGHRQDPDRHLAWGCGLGVRGGLGHQRRLRDARTGRPPHEPRHPADPPASWCLLRDARLRRPLDDQLPDPVADARQSDHRPQAQHSNRRRAGLRRGGLRPGLGIRVGVGATCRYRASLDAGRETHTDRSDPRQPARGQRRDLGGFRPERDLGRPRRSQDGQDPARPGRRSDTPVVCHRHARSLDPGR